MNAEDLFKEITEFSKETHGRTDYDKDNIFVSGENEGEYAPLNHLLKKFESLNSERDILKLGFVYESFELFGDDHFQAWFEKQFSKKLVRTKSKKLSILYLPNNKEILDSIEQVNRSYKILRREQILLNGKNLPVQLGEWYTKCIFGLEQRKSTSQRGFDFYLKEKRVEVKIHWADQSSPKGVKLRKSLVELSEYCIVLYLARNFVIREICFLDSQYVVRKFSGKGHSIFLKDSDISPYFFSNSTKHSDKVMNSNILLKYSSPQLALKLSGNYD